ncbi:hypothetical protein ACFE04_011178 [Oxalis oulophora]
MSHSIVMSEEVKETDMSDEGKVVTAKDEVLEDIVNQAKEEAKEAEIILVKELLSPVGKLLSWFQEVISWKRPLMTFTVIASTVIICQQRRYGEECRSLSEYRSPKFMIGDGNNIYDFTYVENVAHAHRGRNGKLRMEYSFHWIFFRYHLRLTCNSAYFITNMEPIKFWEFFSRIVEGFGYERPRIKIPAIAAMPIAHEVELAYKSIGPYGMPITLFFYLNLTTL